MVSGQPSPPPAARGCGAPELPSHELCVPRCRRREPRLFGTNTYGCRHDNESLKGIPRASRQQRVGRDGAIFPKGGVKLDGYVQIRRRIGKWQGLKPHATHNRCGQTAGTDSVDTEDAVWREKERDECFTVSVWEGDFRRFQDLAERASVWGIRWILAGGGVFRVGGEAPSRTRSKAILGGR